MHDLYRCTIAIKITEMYESILDDEDKRSYIARILYGRKVKIVPSYSCSSLSNMRLPCRHIG
eukprot:snap_masked-scaffold_75-processed-gene-0.21-mRNA-1 protein AED:1.00 eAED:1.00 QI:0/-1/0/0/-1/1/1/0/61